MGQSLFIGGGKALVLSSAPRGKKEALEILRKIPKTDDVVVNLCDLQEFKRLEKKIPPILEDSEGYAFMLEIKQFMAATKQNVVRVYDELGELLNESIDGRRFSTDSLFHGQPDIIVGKRRIVNFK